jgi:hypothetical protein
MKHKFFSYSDTQGLETFGTFDEAKDRANEILDAERDYASNDLWDEAEVESIRFGCFFGECRESSRVDRDSLTESEIEEGGYNFNGCDSLVEYELVID